MRAILASVVRKVMAIDQDAYVNNKEILATFFSISFILLLVILMGRVILVGGV